MMHRSGGHPQCIPMSPLQAFEIARRLEEHPRIARVHYPGLPSHPDHSIAVQQMHGFGGVISFEVGFSGEAVLLSSCRPWWCCTHFSCCYL